MALLFYSLCLLTLVLLTAAYLTRARWLPLVPGASHLYTALPTTFRGDVEAGLHSAAFDMTGNIEGEDGRAGLDEAGKRAVLHIMRRRGLGFDEARRVYVEQSLGKAGIGPDGVPKDPKFVSFS